MKLIAESGSTRTEWALVEDNHLIQRVFTEGLNPFLPNAKRDQPKCAVRFTRNFFQKKTGASLLLWCRLYFL